MTISIVRPIRYTTDPDLLGGPNGQAENYILLSGGGSNNILQSGNRGNILQSGTTNKILLSGGGSDELLLSGNFIKRTN